MTDSRGAKRYLRLFEQIGAVRARAMLDKLQVVALASPGTLRELEAFLDRNLGLEPPSSRLDSRARTRSLAGLLAEGDDDDDPTTGSK
jgi:hypothetical protein